ncbi:putative glycerol-3-phosphate transporter 1 [Hibiscus syriacus]|uniref:Glycerol-3-phosphate transporter 1 n=1 Tax=Hibiscus syriacus TaxID=106335 RepID=A0A6A3BYT8_HIBSY|nr:putative glycerol-3-phosphate transporter 1 [Hibiscus syriacus]
MRLISGVSGESESMADTNYSKPLGIRFIEHIRSTKLSYGTHQAIVLVVTFVAYTSYHATRKTTSIVKIVLDPQSSDAALRSLHHGWAPFDGSDGTTLLGQLDQPVRFIDAWKIPGVAPFAFCLFFAKLVAYTFLYWLPYYISHTAIEGEYLSNETAGNLSTFFDVGGVLGGILAGHISDRLDARAITAATFMYCAIPALFFYRSYGHISLAMNVALMFVCGMFVNGPYALITTAVSADLGTHSSLRGNSKALATVTAIVDGTGSVGAAIGPLLTGYISAESWSTVFTMLMGAALVAGLLLTRLVVAEVAATISDSRPHGGSQPGPQAPELDV